jgi:lipoprotein-anchoring transpeptidase ErfK/SrfK
MTQIFAPNRRPSSGTANALVLVGALAGALLLAPLAFPSAASAQTLGYASTEPGAVAPDDTGTAADDQDGQLPERLRRTIVNLDTREAPGTVIIDTRNTALYYVLGGGRAIRYGVGVGRQGFTWSGAETISRKAEWPDWYPPSEMIAPALSAAFHGRRSRQSAGRTRDVSRLQRVPHPRHQRSHHHRQVRLLGLYPPDQ